MSERPLAALTVGLLLAFLATPILRAQQVDTLVFKDGTRKQGRVSITGGSVSLAVPSQYGDVSSQHSPGTIARVEFALSPPEKQTLEKPEAAPVASLQGLWRRVGPFAGVVPSIAPGVGAAYAAKLLESDSAEDNQRGVELVAKLAVMANLDAEILAKINLLQVDAALKSGDVEAARKLIDNATTVAGDAIAGFERMDVQFRLTDAEVASGQLTQLVEEWPKWELMPEIIEERRQLIARALRGYLYPVAFHPGVEDLTASGLMKATQLYDRIGSTKEARRRAEDIVNFFPVAPYVEEAKSYLDKNPLPEDPT